MYTDTIADYITRIRNASCVNKKTVKIPISNLKKNISKILLDEGYILNYEFHENKKTKYNKIIKGYINLTLKYSKVKNSPVIKCIKRVSKPGLRKYCKFRKLPRILNGMGVAIISTSQGIMTDKKAKSISLGGEILFYIY